MITGFSRRAGRPALGVAAFVLILAGFAVAAFPGRPRAVVFTTLAWSGFFALLNRHGYTALAIQAAALFGLVIVADLLNYTSLAGSTIVAYTGWLMAVFGVVVASRQLLPRRLGSVPLLCVAAFTLTLAAIAVVHIWHNLVFGVPVTPDVFYAIYQTNVQESFEFLWEYFGGGPLIAVVLGLLGVSLLGHFRYSAASGRLSPRLLTGLVAVPLAMLASSGGDARIVARVAENIGEYRAELAEFRRLADLRARGGVVIQATKTGTSETYVVVIGESLNRNHMQLYGYHRETTPRLESLYRAGELLKFENAHSTHTNSMPSLSLALTKASRRNGLAFFEAPSILEVARAAGMETHWVTNQVLYGPFDHLVSVVAHSAERLIALNRNVGATAETQLFDEATIPVLEQILEHRSNRNRLIVVHLSGSHTIYCRRFPKPFDRFNGPLAAGDFGSARGDEQLARVVNCYDNSVLYNDYVVAGLLAALRRHGGVTGFFYFSDHGEDVIRRRGHHSGRFTFDMVEVPLLTWLSEEYRRAYPGRYAALRARGDAVFGTDFVYDTVLGIAGIETQERDAVTDLSGPAWGTSDIDLSLLDGERHFLEAANVRYQQRRNIARLAERGLLSRVLPHRVNSTGKLAEICYAACRGLEVDLLFRSYASSGYFEVGHDENHASGIRLADFLERLPWSGVEKLWFDVKNLDAANLDAMTSEITALDHRFELRERMIFESQAADLLPAVGRLGYYTSYYLPTEVLMHLESVADEDALHREAERIARAVKNGELRAVSFDARLYGFVKKHLEPSLPPTVAYHTWDTRLGLADPSFLQRLEAMDWFADARVETIFVTYRSELTL